MTISNESIIDVIRRRKLNNGWFRLYINVLPGLVNNVEVMNYALEVKDEDLIIDILKVRDGKIDPIHADPNGSEAVVTYGAQYITMLKRFVQAGLSQEFGDKLASFPTFITVFSFILMKITVTIDRLQLLESRREGYHNQILMVLYRLIEDLGYFNRIGRSVLQTYLQEPDHLYVLLDSAADDEEATKILTLAQYNMAFISDNDIAYFVDKLGRFNPQANRAITRLTQYPYVRRT
jgi:hypothetical protein